MKNITIGLLLATTLGTSAWAADPDEGTGLEAGVVRLAASMNSLALACGHLNAQAVEAAKSKQRAAAVRDMKLTVARFDQMYAGYEADFNKKWAGGSAAQKQQTCSQLPRP